VVVDSGLGVDLTIDEIPAFREVLTAAVATDDLLRRGGSIDVQERSIAGPPGTPDLPAIILRPAGPYAATRAEDAPGGAIRVPSGSTASSPGEVVTQAVHPCGPASTASSAPGTTRTSPGRSVAGSGRHLEAPGAQRLAPRGRACTEAAAAAALEAVAAWRARLGEDRFPDAQAAMAALASRAAPPVLVEHPPPRLARMVTRG
jgi:hypothetical protein